MQPYNPNPSVLRTACKRIKNWTVGRPEEQWPENEASNGLGMRLATRQFPLNSQQINFHTSQSGMLHSTVVYVNADVKFHCACIHHDCLITDQTHFCLTMYMYNNNTVGYLWVVILSGQLIWCYEKNPEIWLPSNIPHTSTVRQQRSQKIATAWPGMCTGPQRWEKFLQSYLRRRCG